MKGYHYVGLDVHKKSITFCVKEADGTIVEEGRIEASRKQLDEWARGLGARPWIGGMEATMFTGWVYDYLNPYAAELQVAHPYMLRAYVQAKHRSDKISARTLADLLRANLFPRCHMLDEKTRELRRVLRHRNFLVAEAARMKNKASSMLMEVGVEYDKKKLHGKRYFRELVDSLEFAPESVIDMLKLTRTSIEVFTSAQRRLLEGLRADPFLSERVQRLMTIPGVGQVTALTWALEVGDPHRFPTRKHAISYCGLCAGMVESAGKEKRMPLSKQRNKHLQSVLVEAAKMAPQYNVQLAQTHTKELDKVGNRNRATLAVARKLVGYLLSVDKNGKDFELRQ